jgi:hypothetical protein
MMNSAAGMASTAQDRGCDESHSKLRTNSSRTRPPPISLRGANAFLEKHHRRTRGVAIRGQGTRKGDLPQRRFGPIWRGSALLAALVNAGRLIWPMLMPARR